MSPASALTEQQLRALIGKTAGQAYAAILLANVGLCTCTVFRYSSPPKLQERITVGAAEQQIVERALVLKREIRLPFWETVFAACLERGECSQALLHAALFHSGPGVPVEYHRTDIEAGLLEKLAYDDEKNVGLGSRVLMSQQMEMHMNMLDFHCGITDTNARIVHQVCRELFPTGFLILNSGDSYHAISLGLVTSEERIVTLGKALLFNPVIDAFYVGHQLQQTCSSIRISRGGRSKMAPTVIDIWSP